MTAFAPTHTIPAGGLQAWDGPDASRPAVADVVAGLEVEVQEQYGDWARVTFSNGWEAWLDGRALVALPAAAPVGTSAPSPAPPSQTPATPAASPPAYPPPVPGWAPSTGDRSPTTGALAGLRSPDGRWSTDPRAWALPGGALLAIIASFLPWFSAAGFSIDAFDTPLGTLVSDTSTAGPDIGLVVLVLAVAGVAASFTSGAARTVGPLVAAAIIALIAVIWIVRVAGSLEGPEAPSLLSALGFGVYVTLIGAAFMAWGKPSGTRSEATAPR